jgi:hypothetical protein
MRFLAPLSVALALLAACGSTSQSSTDGEFAKPNQIMGEEIQNRISQIPFLHRTELYDSLRWLWERGEPAIPALLTGLRHDDPKVRSNCAFVLGQINDRRVLKDLRPLIDDKSEVVRLEAARSLVLMGDVRYAPHLIASLDSDKTQVRYMCHEALRAATGRDFGYDHLSENVTQRRQSVLQWRTWWAEQSGDAFFANEYAGKHGLTPSMPDTTQRPSDVPAAPGVEMAPTNEGAKNVEPMPVVPGVEGSPTTPVAPTSPIPPKR